MRLRPLASQKDKRTGEYSVSYPVIGTPPDAVAVPTHFFKVILAERRGSAFVTAGFVLPNRPIGDKKELREFQAPLDVIEKQSGLLFFDKVRRVYRPEKRWCRASLD